MKSVLLSVCLTAAAVYAPITLYPTRVSNLEGDVAMGIAMGTAIPSSLTCIPSTQIVVLQADRLEVHAVVVDMPERASLSHASPETWDTLPMSDPPHEQSPATTVLQLAVN